MSRIPPVDRAAFSPELRSVTDHIPDDQLGSLRIYGRVPTLAMAWLGMVQAVHHEGIVPQRTIELVRLRIAAHNQCPRCMSMRLDPNSIDEAIVCRLDSEAVESIDELSEAEQVAIRFGELLASDHREIDDELFARLAQHYSPDQITELALKAATFVGYGRLGAVIRLVDDLPDQYAADGPLTFTRS